MTHISAAHLKSRPQRIAFLVNPNTEGAIDTIFQIINFANKSWGGGYYLIMPTDGKKIDAYWWMLLQYHDSDIIYTTLELDPCLISRIYREIVPSRIIKSLTRVLSDLNPISCLYIPSFLSQVKSYSYNLTPVYLTSEQSGQHDSFFRMNFGLLEQTVSNDTLLNHSFVTKTLIDDATDPNSFMAGNFSYNSNKPLFPKDLAKFWSHSPFSVKHHPLARAFHLFIGDTAEDLIWAWNRTLMSSGYNGRDFLWVSYRYFDNESNFHCTLNKWISNVYWDNTNSQIKGCVISSSIANSELQNIKNKLHEGRTPIFWATFDDPVQLYQQLELEDYLKIATIHSPIEDVGLDASIDCQFRTQYCNHTARLIPAIPPFIDKQKCTGEFMVDLDLDYQSSKGEHSAFRLRLPKRYNISKSLFSDNYSRPLNNGKVSIQVSARDSFFNMTEPSTHSMLRSFGHVIPEKIEKQIHYQSPKYIFENSSAGNSLVRLLEVFGSLKLAAEFFDDPFWVSMGLRFCNLQSVESQEKKELAILKKNLFDAAQEIPEMGAISEESYMLLAGNLQGKLNRWQTTNKYLSVDEINDSFNKFVGKQIKKNDKSTNWEAVKFEDHYLPYLEEFVRKGVLRIGSQLCCNYCGHKSWLLLDDIRHRSNCSACGSGIEIPLKPNLTLRLNDIVRDSIRENCLPYVVRELHNQGRFPCDMFDFLPCQNVFCKGSADAFTDLDIVVFRGSDLVIGEVKSEPSGLKSKDILKLFEVAKQMLPQEVVIATQEGPLDSATQLALAQLKNDLESYNIRFKFNQLKRFVNWG